MRTQRRRFVTIAAVLLGLAVMTGVLAFYVVRVVEGVRRAAEDSRRVEQRYVEQWPAEQKKGLASGERSDVHFYSTSNTDVLIRRFAGMPEIKRLTFQLTDLTDEGVKVVAGHYAFLRSRTGKGVSELEKVSGTVSMSGLGKDGRTSG